MSRRGLEYGMPIGSPYARTAEGDERSTGGRTHRECSALGGHTYIILLPPDTGVRGRKIHIWGNDTRAEDVEDFGQRYQERCNLCMTTQETDQ